MSAPKLETLAAAALAVLAEGAERMTGEETGWRAVLTGTDGIALDIRLLGPDLPSHVPAEVAAPEQIARELRWVGAYRLVVEAPLIVFDLAWNAGEPLRIMTFSRGDWEAELLALAGMAAA